MRPLTLHPSALNDDEYALFTSSLAELVAPDSAPTEHEKPLLRTREVRAWLRGRYAELPLSELDAILQFFAPPPGQEAMLSAGQFFATLRLVIHVQAGDAVDCNMVFVQGGQSSKRSRPEDENLKILHNRGWGREWEPRCTFQVTATQSTPDDDGPVVYNVETQKSSGQKYQSICYGDLRSLLRAFGKVVHPFGEVIVGRPEYILLIERLMNGDLKDFQRIVLTGHPGIGKTMFLFFLLLWLMQHKMPTAVQLSTGWYFILDDQGPAMCENGQAERGILKRLEACWALVDGNSNVTAPCMDILDRAKTVIQMTSPHPDRFKGWSKDYKASYVIMDLPTALDIAGVAHFHGHSIPDVIELTRKWGPSLRTVDRILQQPAMETNLLEQTVTQHAKDLTTNRSQSVSLSTSLDGVVFRSQFSSLIFLRPSRRRCDDDIALEKNEKEIGRDGSTRIVERPGLTSYYIPTEHLRTIFEEERAELTSADALSLFEMLSTRSLTRGAAGWHHEMIVHRRLCSSNTNDLSVFGGDDQRSSIMAACNVLLHSTLNALANITVGQKFYWLPDTANFEGIDALLATGQHLYAIQATISNTHGSPQKGLTKVWNKMTVEAREKYEWRVVFVSPDYATAQKLVKACPKLELGLKKKGGRKKGAEKMGVTVWGCVLPENTLKRKAEDDGQ